MRSFQKIFLEINNNCNLNCSFCPEPTLPKGFISETVFASRLKQVNGLSERICLHVWGEPLGHPQFGNLIAICDQVNAPIEITTNATLLQENIYSILISKSIQQINFSLQSFLDNYPAADPKAYLAKIFRFIDLSMLERPDLYLNLRLWNIKEGELDTKSLQVLDAIGSHFGLSINPRVEPQLGKSKKIKDRLYLHFDTRFVWPDLANEFISEQGTCYGTRSQFAILVDGTVVPCCLDKNGIIKLGNIDQEPLEMIFNSTKFLKIKEGFLQNQLTQELCQKCQYATRFSRKT